MPGALINQNGVVKAPLVFIIFTPNAHQSFFEMTPFFVLHARYEFFHILSNAYI